MAECEKSVPKKQAARDRLAHDRVAGSSHTRVRERHPDLFLRCLRRRFRCPQRLPSKEWDVVYFTHTNLTCMNEGEGGSSQAPNSSPPELIMASSWHNYLGNPIAFSIAPHLHSGGHTSGRFHLLVEWRDPIPGDWARIHVDIKTPFTGVYCTTSIGGLSSRTIGPTPQEKKESSFTPNILTL
jgi:hypothetical protein